MDYLAFFVGALVITWAISRITRRLLFRKSTGWVRAVGPNAVTLAVSAAFGGVGMADGGPPQFLLAFVRYLPPVLFLGRDRCIQGTCTGGRPTSCRLIRGR